MPISKGSYINLRRIIEDAENYITALESLGESPKQRTSVMIYLLSKRLDNETRKHWERRAFSSSETRT